MKVSFAMNKYSFSHLTKYSAIGFDKQRSGVVAYSMLNKMPTINPMPERATIEDKPIKIDRNSKAMKMYLEKVTRYHKFMTEQKTEFEIAKRHLANMMGRDPENFSQEDIDECIQYLFPCGLFQKKARPLMKPPEEIFPPRKEAEFDKTGRPHHFLFYTAKPNFFQILHDAVKIIKDLNNFEDKVISGQESDPCLPKIILDTSSWISKEKLEKKINEDLAYDEYNEFILTFEKLAAHKFGKKVEEYIFKYREFLHSSDNLIDKNQPQLLEDGRQVITMKDCKRKSVLVDVSVTYPGTGKFTIEGQDLRFFDKITCREAVLFPLVLSKMLNKVDIEASSVRKPPLGTGDSALANAIRWGISRGLCHFVDANMKERLHLAGLLQREVRHKERKKPGQEGARRKFTWKKR